jgi:stress-induced morphogen
MNTDDEAVERIVRAFDAYRDEHPDAEVEVRRRFEYAVRVRITDPAFRGRNRVDRHDELWPYLDANLADEHLSQVTMLVLVTPDERVTSPSSWEFDETCPCEPTNGSIPTEVEPNEPRPWMAEEEQIEQIEAALEPYQRAHPDAEVEIQRQHRFSIRIRVTNPEFAGRDRVDRDREVSPYLDVLDKEDVLPDITMLLLVTPEERKTSWASMEFDDPIPTRLAETTEER